MFSFFVDLRGFFIQKVTEINTVQQNDITTEYKHKWQNDETESWLPLNGKILEKIDSFPYLT